MLRVTQSVAKGYMDRLERRFLCNTHKSLRFLFYIMADVVHKTAGFKEKTTSI